MLNPHCLPYITNDVQKNKPVVWAIAGSDCGGGAGIQADLKSFFDMSIHGCTAVTAVTAQNTQRLDSINAVNADVLSAQLDSLRDDFMPAVIKLGLLPNAELISCVAKHLKILLDLNQNIYVVCDPVLMSSTGDQLLDDAAKNIFIDELLPLVNLLTPNIAELEFLSGQTVNSKQCLEQSVDVCLTLGVDSVLAKGGHAAFYENNNYCYDFFKTRDIARLITAPRSFYLQGLRADHAAHGTGCRLASAISALIAHKYSLEDAITLANSYVNKALHHSYQKGKAQRQLPNINTIGIDYLVKSMPQFGADTLQFLACDVSGLYPVVDDVTWIEKLLPLGIKTIQLRLKDKSQQEIEMQVGRAVRLQDQYGAQVFINDYWQVAIDKKAFGVHLGQEDLVTADVSAIAKAGLRLGVSTHGWWEIARAHQLAPSYIAIGPIYPTQTKDMPFESHGVEKLKQWVDLLVGRYPIVAIGGITLAKAVDVKNTDVRAIAVVSAITHADDYKKATLALMQVVAS